MIAGALTIFEFPSDSPVVTVPREFSRGAIWADPRLVVAVKFTTWTRDGILRHPSFDGICEGMAPESVVLEKPQLSGMTDG